MWSVNSCSGARKVETGGRVINYAGCSASGPAWSAFWQGIAQEAHETGSSLQYCYYHPPQHRHDVASRKRHGRQRRGRKNNNNARKRSAGAVGEVLSRGPERQHPTKTKHAAVCQGGTNSHVPHTAVPQHSSTKQNVCRPSLPALFKTLTLPLFLLLLPGVKYIRSQEPPRSPMPASPAAATRAVTNSSSFIWWGRRRIITFSRTSNEREGNGRGGGSGQLL